MEINQLVFNYLNKPSEIPDNEIIEEFTAEEDGKVVSYPRKILTFCLLITNLLSLRSSNYTNKNTIICF